MKFLKTMMTVAVAAILPNASLAETHALMPYAYIQAHGTNRIDTGYCAKSLSRYFVDYQLVDPSTPGQAIFGDTKGTKIRCAFYVPTGVSAGIVTWYYRTPSPSTNYKMMGFRDAERRVMTAIHPTDSSGTATVSLYDRTDSVVSNTTAEHSPANSTTTIYLFALNNSDSYIGGEKRIYSFEAADDSSAVMPALFLAPTTNDVGEAGFKDIVTGAFHGEANANRSTEMTFSDGVGSADDYGYENGVFSAKFRAYAEDTATGGVKFGNGEASGAAEAWVARGGSVTLTAVPAAGYDFVGWIGDTWAITSGTTKSATVTVQSGTAVQLLAVFSESSWHWTGAAGDSNWFTAGNWADGSGNAAVSLASGDKFTFDQDGDITVNYNPGDPGFVVGNLFFAVSSGAVSVTGDEIASLTNIVCRNGKENVMSNAVTFSGDVDVTAMSGHVLFAGGATGYKVANHIELYGNYNLTVEGDYTMASNTVLKSGSTLRMPNGTFYKHLGDYTLESCATTIVKCAKININRADPKLMLTNNGVFVVTDNAYVSARNATAGYTQYLSPNGSGVFIANEVNIRNGAHCYIGGYAVIGPGGINLDTNCYARLLNLGTSRFGAYADWEIGCDTAGVAASGPAMYRQGGAKPSDITFDTSDYYDPSIGRTITLKGPIGDYNYDNHVSNAPLNITVAGVGTLAFDYANNNYDKLFSSGLTVTDSATVSVVPGISPGAGAVTLRDNATLKVAGSGTVALGGNLTLGENAALAFNFTEKDAAPVLSIPAGSTLPATVNVKVSAADGLRLRAGSYALTSGYDFTGKSVNLVDPSGLVASIAVDGNGNIVLAPNVKGVIISVR
ncbi:MAG: hypothetical protein IJH50_10210 [Kiritimatiellae bacterium]|nr:hypothetical protein [Kiritimatiellia bacterium]